MPQLHFSVDERTAQQLAERAAARGQTLSKYLATIVRRAVPDEWPVGYLDAVIGSCADSPIVEPPDLALDEVDL
jgi:hypothetical protein